MLDFIRETGTRMTPSGSVRKMGLYKCSCGNIKEVCIYNVKSGKTKFCGCEAKRIITEVGKTKGKDRWNYKHGMFGTRFYNIYYGARNRCINTKDSNYRFYGAKGVKFEWGCFEDFMNDMYESYNKHIEEYGIKQTTLDRLDSKRHYCKENCRWATYKEQAREKIGMSELVNNIHKMKKL